MDVAVCYSGGTDSTLAALLLDPVADVTLVGGTFGITPAVEHAREAAAAIDRPFEAVSLDPAVASEAVAEMVADGFPRNGIQRVHEHALEVVAGHEYDAVADGTRRDDRVPTVPRAVAQRLEDRYEVCHLAPLAGVGHAAVDAFAANLLQVAAGPSETVPTGDYEAELRALMADEYGEDAVATCFPAHTQSRVVGLAGPG